MACPVGAGAGATSSAGRLELLVSDDDDIPHHCFDPVFNSQEIHLGGSRVRKYVNSSRLSCVFLIFWW